MQLPIIPGMGNSAPASVCGDGVVGAGEACDDGNLVDFDACTSACTNAGCGDGVTRRDLTDPLSPGYEACDDGNDRDDDGCTNACLSPKCGDGRVFQNNGLGSDGYEECDDGNINNNDSCTAQCFVARCGDGFIHNQTQDGEAVEECDDGNAVDLDGCRNNCQIARCGDGIVRSDIASGSQDECLTESDCDAGERCLHRRCYPVGFERCDDENDDNTDACLSGCVAARCGDGVVRTDLGVGELGYEACDDGDTIDNDECNNACQLATCGDGVRRTDLDDRVRGPEALCSDGCFDQEVCMGLICVPAGYEACDDGNLNASDTCVNCELPGTSANAAAQSCAQLLRRGQTESGVYWLDFDGRSGPFEPAPFYCDQTTDGGGWLHIFGENAPSDAGCSWFRWSRLSPGDMNSEVELPAEHYTTRCLSSGIRFRHIHMDLDFLASRMVLETPFDWSSIRYSGQLSVRGFLWDQPYQLPTTQRRHPEGLQDQWIMSDAEDCMPTAIDESIGSFVGDRATGNSVSWVANSYVGNRCSAGFKTEFFWSSIVVR